MEMEHARVVAPRQRGGRGAFHDHVKVNFFKGALLNDPDGLFNAGLEARATRAIDIHEGDRLDEAAFRKLVGLATALNRPTPKTRRP